jgi:hypothetical protein
LASRFSDYFILIVWSVVITTTSCLLLAAVGALAGDEQQVACCRRDKEKYTVMMATIVSAHTKVMNFLDYDLDDKVVDLLDDLPVPGGPPLAWVQVDWNSYVMNKLHDRSF